MATYDQGFSRRSSSERDLQPVAILSVDPVKRTAIAITRTRHRVYVNCAYATGDTITIPAAGEQWYVERFANEWRLYGRIPFNDPTLNIKPEEGQVSVGSARGPLELNGTEIRANNILRLGGVYYRDSGDALQRSTDQITWTSLGTADAAAFVALIAGALTSFTGDGDALQALADWAAPIQTVLDNFTEFWTQLCQNVFVNGLKGMGFGDTDLAKIVDGLQNFIDYLFGVVFCNFDGHLTPQTILARLRDLVAPIAANPFLQGLQGLAEVLGTAVGGLLQDAISGITEFTQLVFNIIFCNTSEADQAKIAAIVESITAGAPPGLATVIKSLSGLFTLLTQDHFLVNDVEVPNLIALFIHNLQAIFKSLNGGEGTGSLVQDAISGLVKVVETLTGIIFFCDTKKLTDLATIVAGVLPGFDTPAAILRKIYELLGNPADPTSGGLLNNPIILIINKVADLLGIGPNSGPGTTALPLLDQLIQGTEKLVISLLKTLTTIVPLGSYLSPDDGVTKIPLWHTILWFVPDAVWTKVNDPTVTLDFDLVAIFGEAFNPIKLLLRPIEVLLGWGFESLFQFLKNLGDFFDGMGFFDGDFDLGFAVDYFLKNILHLVDPVTGFIKASLLEISELTIDNIQNLVAYITGVANATGDDLQIFFTRLRNLFGGVDFITSGNFDFVGAATGFINSVLSFGTLESLANLLVSLENAAVGLGLSLAQQVGNAVITAIRGFPVVGPLIADTLQGLIDGVVGFVRLATGSGTNLLPDPGGEKSAFWNNSEQPYVSQLTSASAAAAGIPFYKKSGDSSLTIVSGGSAARAFYWTINDLGKVNPIRTNVNEIFLAECYVLAPTTNQGTGTITLVALYSDSTGTNPDQLATSNLAVTKSNTNWMKLSGGFKVPTGYDRAAFGFLLAANATTANDRFYVDNMLVRESTATQNAIDGISQAILGGTDTFKTADDLKNAVNGVTNLTRGTTASGSNLLADPKVNYAKFWTGQANLSTSTTAGTYRSTARSLAFVSSGSSATTWFDFTVNDLAQVTPIVTTGQTIYYCEAWVMSPSGNSWAIITLHGKAVSLASPSTRVDCTTESGSAVNAVYPSAGVWTRVYGYFRVPDDYDGFVAGITLQAGWSTSGNTFYVDDMLVQDVTATVNTNKKLYNNSPTPSTDGKIDVNAVPGNIPQGNVQGSGGYGTTLSGDIGTSSGGTGLIGQVYGTNGYGGLVGYQGRVPSLESSVGNANNGTGLNGAVYGSTGLLYRLYGGTTNAAISQRIQQSALPAELKTAVGSGVSLIRAYKAGADEIWNNTYYNPPIRSANPGRNKLVSDYFNRVEVANSSNDLSVVYDGQAVAINAPNPGWYLVQVSYGINTGNTAYSNGTGGTSYYNYNWGFTPLLYITPSSGTVDTSAIIRSGTDITHTWATSAQGTFGWAPRCVQASWIVYLPAGNGNTAVRPGYDFSGHLVGSVNYAVDLFRADAYGVDTYFSVSLLNRSLL